MYEKFYGLNERPFHIVPNPDFLYLSAKHQNALTYLEYGLMEGVGFILLTGEIGTGKTTLIRHILNQIESEMEVAVIFNTNVTAEQLVSLILQEFELAPAAGDKVRNLDILFQYLIDKYAKRQKVLLIIDEAQNLSRDALEEVRMLSNLQSDDQMLLQIMLVGQPELKAKLKSPGLIQLSQRIAVNYHLVALTREEVGSYIAFRLEKAGGRPDIFTSAAVDLIYQASGGIPRTINLLCDSALVYGFADELETIEAEIVEQVLGDKGGMGLDVGMADATALSAEGLGEQDVNLIMDRLRMLETNVQQLKVQVQWQTEELERRAESFKDELVQVLKEMHAREQKRNDKLLAEYNRLKEKYKALQKILVREDRSPAGSAESNIEKREFDGAEKEISSSPRFKLASWFRSL